MPAEHAFLPPQEEELTPEEKEQRIKEKRRAYAKEYYYKRKAEKKAIKKKTPSKAVVKKTKNEIVEESPLNKIPALQHINFTMEDLYTLEEIRREVFEMYRSGVNNLVDRARRRQNGNS